MSLITRQLRTIWLSESQLPQMPPVASKQSADTRDQRSNDIEAREEFRFQKIKCQIDFVEHVPLTSAIRKLYGVQVTRSNRRG